MDVWKNIKYLSRRSEHNSSNLALVMVVSMCLGPSAVAVMKGKLEEDNIFINIKFQLNFSQTPICTVRERESTSGGAEGPDPEDFQARAFLTWHFVKTLTNKHSFIVFTFYRMRIPNACNANDS